MKQLIHNGVLVPKYEPRGFYISVKAGKTKLTPEQEEMAVAWIKKLGTEYAKDRIFVRNFFKDFRKALGISEELSPEDFDFSMIKESVERDRMLKLSLSKEEKKRLTQLRKAERETNKEKYGYAIVDNVRTEISNYTAEPSCIFMGRGKHPLRGRWKEGPREEDIELNLSVDRPKSPGNWKAILWQPNVMWIARWQDKLTGKMRYVWLSDNSPLKQKNDIEKFNKARELQRDLTRIQSHIWGNLDADDLRRRKTATVCFLIDKLKIRVGDEKDPDEAETVGASTLRPEHIHFGEDGKVIFNFLGKDSVPHIFDVKLPPEVVGNLKEFSAKPDSILFDGVDSKRVSEFLDGVMEGLSAKVFRTCYASEAVEKKLESAPAKVEDPDYVKKYVATMANLEASMVCNHRRTIPKTWESSLEKKKARLIERIKRAQESQDKIKRQAKEKEERYMERLRKQEEMLKTLMEKRETYQQQMAGRRRQGMSVKSLERRISSNQRAMKYQEQRIKMLKNKYAVERKKLRGRLEKRRQKDKMMIEKMRLQIKTKRETRDYNLTTSLKSYIDPRIYYRWGIRVDYDWKLYYPKALQRKFSWVEDPDRNTQLLTTKQHKRSKE